MSPSQTPRFASSSGTAGVSISNGCVFDGEAGTWVRADLAITNGTIVGWGPHDAHEVIDVDGAALTPGFIDAHMHLESTKLWIDEFVRTVLPHGTTAVAADPHEIANVLGVPGVRALLDAAKDLPFRFSVCAPSCVPASRFEHSGAALDSSDIRELIERHGAHGVGEVMDFPGVISGDEEMLARIAASGGARVNSHAPGVTGADLDEYIAAGVHHREPGPLPRVLRPKLRSLARVRARARGRECDRLDLSRVWTHRYPAKHRTR